MGQGVDEDKKGAEKLPPPMSCGYSSDSRNLTSSLCLLVASRAISS